MRKTLLGTSALAGVAMLASSAADAAATYITVAPPAGAISISVFGINDNNIVVGSYTDSAGTQHGYYGPPALRWRTASPSARSSIGLQPETSQS